MAMFWRLYNVGEGADEKRGFSTEYLGDWLQGVTSQVMSFVYLDLPMLLAIDQNHCSEDKYRKHFYLNIVVSVARETGNCIADSVADLGWRSLTAACGRGPEHLPLGGAVELSFAHQGAKFFQSFEGPCQQLLTLLTVKSTTCCIFLWIHQQSFHFSQLLK